MSRAQASTSRRPLFDVDRLEDLDLLGQGEVGGVARDVGEPSGLGDLAQLRGDLAGAAAKQDVLEHGAVLAGELDGGGGRLTVVEGFGLDPERVTGAGHASTDGGALVAADGDCVEATGEGALLHHLGDHADVGVAALDVGDEQEVPTGRPRCFDGGAGLVGLEGHGKDHARQDHAGLEG